MAAAVPRPEKIGTTTLPSATSILRRWWMAGRERDEREQETRRRHDKREPTSDSRTFGARFNRYGLRPHPFRRPSSLSKRWSSHATSSSHTALCQPSIFPRIPHGVHILFSSENGARHPTRHAVSVHRWDSHLRQLLWSAGSRDSHQHQRPAIYPDDERKFPSVRVQSRSNLLASGSYRGDLDVEERVESHDRVDGRVHLPL